MSFDPQSFVSELCRLVWNEKTKTVKSFLEEHSSHLDGSLFHGKSALDSVLFNVAYGSRWTQFELDAEGHYIVPDEVFNRAVKSVQLFTKFGSDVSNKDKNGLTALHLASGHKYGEPKSTRFLLLCGADPYAMSDATLTFVERGKRVQGV